MIHSSGNTLSDMPMRHAGNTPYRLLDAWRGVAALWVVMLHVRLPSTPAWLFNVSAGGHLGVPMFFVISGYCIANAALRSVTAPSPLKHFVAARVHRIYPPYFCASLLAVGLSLLLTALIQRHVVASSQIAELDLQHQSWRFWVGALTLTQTPLHAALLIRVLWSLCYEAVFYAVIALFLFGAIKLKRPSLLLTASAILTLGILAWLGAGSADGISLSAQSLFYLGFASALLLLFRWDSQLARFGPVRALAGIGLFSYSLYLIHLLALGIVTQGLNRIGFIPAHPLLAYGLKLALCVAVGWLFFCVCERPFLDLRQRQVLQASRSPEGMVQ